MVCPEVPKLSCKEAQSEQRAAPGSGELLAQALGCCHCWDRCAGCPHVAGPVLEPLAAAEEGSSFLPQQPAAPFSSPDACKRLGCSISSS